MCDVLYTCVTYCMRKPRIRTHMCDVPHLYVWLGCSCIWVVYIYGLCLISSWHRYTQVDTHLPIHVHSHWHIYSVWVCVSVYVYLPRECVSIDICSYRQMGYGVATISRLLKIMGLFCKRALLKRRYSAKETYNFKEPTNRSHPIGICTHNRLTADTHLPITAYIYTHTLTWKIHTYTHTHSHIHTHTHTGT